jgi:hypothetical protein
VLAKDKMQNEVAKPSFYLIKSKAVIKFNNFFKQKLPYYAYNSMANLLGNSQMKKNADLWLKMMTKMDFVIAQF